MTITVTETPRLANAAERKVWQALVERLEPNDLLVAGQRVTDHLKDHVVVLPNTELRQDFDLPECPRWKIIDRTDLPNLVDKLKEVLVRQELDRPLLSPKGIDQLATALSGRGLPQRDVVARALANEDAADALTEHQAVILDATRLLTRVEVRGGAGSGKTFLAKEQARRLAQQGQRVALVCYSHGLASYLERIAATWPRRQQPAYVGEFHDLGKKWGAPEGPDEALRSDETVKFWEHDLPLQMADLAAQLEPGHRFDSIVVDEAQDFADAWWDRCSPHSRTPSRAASTS